MATSVADVQELSRRVIELEGGWAQEKARADQLSGDMSILQAKMSAYADWVEKEKVAFMQIVGGEIEKHKVELAGLTDGCRQWVDSTRASFDALISDCQTKFGVTDADLRELCRRQESGFDGLVTRLTALEAGGGGPGPAMGGMGGSFGGA